MYTYKADVKLENKKKEIEISREAQNLYFHENICIIMTFHAHRKLHPRYFVMKFMEIS